MCYLLWPKAFFVDLKLIKLNFKLKKQAGAELCQAQAQVDLPAEAEFSLTIGCWIQILLEKASFACFGLYQTIWVLKPLLE